LYTIAEEGILDKMFFWIIALLIALSIHEYAHARVADELGDPTPRVNGRLTLNPLAHLDPLGTFALLFFRFGWGKPVPIDPYNLRNPRRDQALIALAGPASNLIFTLILSFVYRFLPFSFFSSFVLALASMNVGLAIFNLLPFGPLDGAKVFLGFIPEDLASEWEEVLNQYGLFILLILFLPLANGNSLLGITLRPAVDFLIKTLFSSPII